MNHFKNSFLIFCRRFNQLNTDRLHSGRSRKNKNVIRNKFPHVFWNSLLQNRRLLQESEWRRDCHREQPGVFYVCDSPLSSYLHRGVSRQSQKLRHQAQPRDLLQEKSESFRENVKIENFRIQTLWSGAEGFRQRFSLFLQRAFPAIITPVGHWSLLHW